jgi:dipeptidyl aminopeptidase/acylaminoacyl peptidase
VSGLLRRATNLPIVPGSTWTVEKMMDVKQVGSVHVAPDGQRVAFTVREALMEGEKSEYLTHVYLASTDGTGQIQLTYGAPCRNGASSSEDPQWSPDGEWIAFTSARSGKRNVWLIRVCGGEARQLTDVQTSVSSFKWSPDGKQIAFTAIEPPSPQEERAAREKNDVRVVGQGVKMRRLYTIPVETGRPVCALTAGNYTVGVGDLPALYDWSPDGKAIAFTHACTPSWDDWMSAGISLVDVESKAVRPLLCQDAAAIDPHFSPDGRWVACKIYDHPAWEWSSVVHLVPVDGGPARPLAETYDRRPGLVGWSADGSQLYYDESYGTRVRLGALPIDGGPPRTLYEPEGVISQAKLNRRRTVLGFVLEDLARPPEVYASRLDALSPVQVSRANEGLHELPLGRTEVIRWTAVDGLEIEGLLTYPVNYEPSTRYPLLLSVHGGPASVFAQEFAGRPSIYGPLAALAARGYAVLRCNVRGSTGYGKAFRRANYRDWGGMDVQDLLAGVDRVITMGVADLERMGVLGWSYGGYMAASVITQTPRDGKGLRFRAAVVGAGIVNLISNAGTTDSPSFTVSHFGSELWETVELLCARSPVLNVSDVTTPTLILHGEQDVRVPVSQGYELYNALKRRGCTVEMVVYPRTGHIPHEPKLLQDVMARTMQWMDRYVHG